jgi:phosphoglycolate phosphatase-like HAD superfamily hydrolase
MKKLILFDIDGTLTWWTNVNKNPHTKAFSEAIRNLYKITPAIEDKKISGLTDSLILKLLMQENGINGHDDQGTVASLMDELHNAFKASFDARLLVLLPGVKPLLAKLKDQGATLGLLTGNLESIAKIKLDALDIWKYFSTGGFGNDPHNSRAELVEYAIKKAGYENDIDKVYLAGDTPRDVEAAKAAGIKHAVCVATGHFGQKELKNAGAEVVLENFKDTQAALRAFGLN